jgi:hypothetical protein
MEIADLFREVVPEIRTRGYYVDTYERSIPEGVISIQPALLFKREKRTAEQEDGAFADGHRCGASSASTSAATSRPPRRLRRRR